MGNDHFLMTPGPTEIPLRVLKAMIRPGVSPGDPDFINIMDDTSNLLKQILGTKNETLFFPGSGRVGIEAAITSVLDPGDKILTVNNGIFGKWLGLTTTAAGGEKVEILSDMHCSVDPEIVRQTLKRNRGVKAIAIVHNETSTGIINPVTEIGKIAKEQGALLILDTVSSAGGDFIRSDEWQVDINCTGCYKCMNCPPGLAIVSVSKEAWDVMARRKHRRSFSLDLYKYIEMWIPSERGGTLIWGQRRHVVEPVPHITYALNEALNMIIEEEPAARYAKNALAGKAIRAATHAMNLTLWANDERDASNTLTAITVPKGMDASKIIQIMHKDYGILIGGGLEETNGKVLRIAHMGFTSGEIYILRTIRQLEKTLLQLGHKLKPGFGIQAANTVFDQAK